MTDEEIDQLLAGVSDGFATLDRHRAPVLHRPDEAGLDYDDVTFPSWDGVPLEGWFIPAPGSGKLVIANHPMGLQPFWAADNLAPWCHEWGPSGNGIEADFVLDYKILHDAGYNVLAYDLRHHGLSGAAHGGIATSGWFEARDVVGSLRYAHTRADTRDMTIGLFSRCLGCNASFAATAQFPEQFAGVRCLVAQPVTTSVIVARQLALAGVPADRLDDAMADIDRRIVLRTSLGFADRDNRAWAKSCAVPTFLYQVRRDLLTDPTDVQTMYDNLAARHKQLHWIEDTTARWDGYLEFQRRPEPMLAWFRRFMA